MKTDEMVCLGGDQYFVVAQGAYFGGIFLGQQISSIV